MTATEHVILVDKNDQPTGTAEKLQAHREGLCHRAFSIFIVHKEPDIKILLQQRALTKYHSPGLWTNTCCSHPRPDEDIVSAGQRRLREEMGIETVLKWVGRFHYIAHFENGLIENEVDHVLIGEVADKTFQANPNEVHDYRWISLPELKNEIASLPQQFTPWLNQALSLAERSLL